ncbi:Lrp/AsnC family transcriptional regulator [Acerihabitans sp. TG2]|uniref:Lrp/AsnC family transcriptional regulator n=1 Tax=Acerihabitans sp. TG2 TaxID=3096008 RepID=UPI002B236491|nr:Lrp/AsnC family transcriptional regulator [Acerihabitans sp. TG2]MEA9392372.1 Lrp/AsnC family transcriptional regulator [Acerihabitans sp. TG2]
MPNISFDAADIRILRELQDAGRITNQQLAEKVGMAASPCWRRVRQLEQQGVIAGYRAVLDRKKVGLGILAFIRIKIDSHNATEARQFEVEIETLPAVIACYAVAGSADFLLQVVSRDLDEYSEFAMTVLRALPRIKEMETTFVLREIKPLGAMPLIGTSLSVAPLGK